MWEILADILRFILRSVNAVSEINRPTAPLSILLFLVLPLAIGMVIFYFVSKKEQRDMGKNNANKKGD